MTTQSAKAPTLSSSSSDSTTGIAVNHSAPSGLPEQLDLAIVEFTGLLIEQPDVSVERLAAEVAGEFDVSVADLLAGSEVAS